MAKISDGWKRNCLLTGGRLTLILSGLDSIPIYFLSSFKLSKRVSLIERMMRNFLWEGCVEGKRAHFVDWDVVTKLKSQGGLGIRNLLMRNKALLGNRL